MDRRDFLKTSAAGLVAAALPPVRSSNDNIIIVSDGSTCLVAPAIRSPLMLSLLVGTTATLWFADGSQRTYGPGEHEVPPNVTRYSVTVDSGKSNACVFCAIEYVAR